MRVSGPSALLMMAAAVVGGAPHAVRAEKPTHNFPNSGSHSVAGYIVFTYTLPVWEPR